MKRLHLAVMLLVIAATAMASLPALASFQATPTSHAGMRKLHQDDGGLYILDVQSEHVWFSDYHLSACVYWPDSRCFQNLFDQPRSI